MTRPWLKFFPRDWRADPRLKLCSLAARGLWIDLIAYMHEGEPYGHLTIDHVAPGIGGIAALTGRPVAEIRKALNELEACQVFSRTAAGVIYSRRMVRDQQAMEEGRAHAERRWAQSREPNGGPLGQAKKPPMGRPLRRRQRAEARLQKHQTHTRSLPRARMRSRSSGALIPSATAPIPKSRPASAFSRR